MIPPKAENRAQAANLGWLRRIRHLFSGCTSVQLGVNVMVAMEAVDPTVLAGFGCCLVAV